MRKREIRDYLLLVGEAREGFSEATKLKLYTPKSEEFREANHTHEEKNLREPGIKSYRNQL